MATISATRKEEISINLGRNGVQANEQAIAGVIEILQNDGRISVATACKRYAETVGVNHQTQTATQARATQGASIQSQTLDNAARGLANQMKQYVGAKAVDYLMQDLANGDLGEYFDTSLSDAFGAFGQVFDAETQAIAAGDQSPLLLAASISMEATD